MPYVRESRCLYSVLILLFRFCDKFDGEVAYRTRSPPVRVETISSLALASRATRGLPDRQCTLLSKPGIGSEGDQPRSPASRGRRLEPGLDGLELIESAAYLGKDCGGSLGPPAGFGGNVVQQAVVVDRLLGLGHAGASPTPDAPARDLGEKAPDEFQPR